ncbi:MAG: phenylalanine--tRNA ligase beta subunit-related protein [Patescibacteria group bacterium]|jgi:DNA/RNA-binding domain of Phe-tRNA-synthetase-like protein
MKFTVSPNVFEIFPELQIAVAVFKGIDNSKAVPKIAELLRSEEMFCRSIFSELKVSEHPNIQNWRKAYTKFGAGSHYRSSVEALTKRVSKGESLPSINNLVDIYNLVSLKHLLPVGGEDLKKIKGDLTLTFATGEEKFHAIYAEENDPPLKGEIVYVDDNKDVLCRRFNWREAEKSKITEETTKAIIYIEGIPPVNAIETKEAAQDLAAYVEKFCGGSAELFLVNKNFPIFNFTK